MAYREFLRDARNAFRAADNLASKLVKLRGKLTTGDIANGRKLLDKHRGAVDAVIRHLDKSMESAKDCNPDDANYRLVVSRLEPLGEVIEPYCSARPKNYAIDNLGRDVPDALAKAARDGMETIRGISPLLCQKPLVCG